MAITAKRRVFIEEYLQTWNASEAARRAEYAHPGSEGHRLLKNAEIQEAIHERLADKAMSSDEVLVRLAEHARASMGDFVTLGLDGEPLLDFEKAEDKLHLIKKLWKDKKGDWRIELYDAQAALLNIGRGHAMFVDKHEVTGPVTLRVVYEDE